MKREQAQRLMDAILIDLARMYDMPELVGCKIIKSVAGTHRPETYNVNADVTPRGQITSFVETLNVGVTLYDEPDATGYLVELHPGYRNLGGGSNGNTTRLVAVVTPGYQDEPEKYIGLISDKMCRAITQRHFAIVRENCKTKSGDEIKKLYGGGQ